MGSGRRNKSDPAHPLRSGGECAPAQRSDRAIHNRNVRLTIRGVVWGLHHLTERPDAHAMAAWYGLDSADWGVILTGEAVGALWVGSVRV